MFLKPQWHFSDQCWTPPWEMCRPGQTHQVPRALAKPVGFALGWEDLLRLSRILAVAAVVLLCGELWTCLEWEERRTHNSCMLGKQNILLMLVLPSVPA